MVSPLTLRCIIDVLFISDEQIIGSSKESVCQNNRQSECNAAHDITHHISQEKHGDGKQCQDRYDHVTVDDKAVNR